MQPDNTTAPDMSLMEMIDYIETQGYAVVAREDVEDMQRIIKGWI